jgi:predicted 3-demethylubiquinone-9 3-methyltransferase (glyoxalase superfamily)
MITNILLFRFWLCFEISDCTTKATCTLFDDEGRRMLNTYVTNLLDSSRGNAEDVPKVIEQLYGKVFIFQFRLNNYNLTKGRQGSVVRKIFVLMRSLRKKCFMIKMLKLLMRRILTKNC